MPANFPEIWLGRVVQNLTAADEATFLQGIPELGVDVTQINEGEASEMNKIYVPSTEFEVEILVNNNTYPIPFQEYTDGTIEITLDKYQTKVITLGDDATIGASYDKIDVVTRASVRGITVEKYQRAIHSIAPLKETEDTPIIVATGDADATGRKRLTYEDLVEANRKTMHFGDKRLVLSHDHFNDLLLDRKNFGNQLVDYNKGKPAPFIVGFEIHKYDGKMPTYAADGNKKPYGAVADDTDVTASVIFAPTGIAKKTGMTKQYFVASAQNPQRQSNDLAYRHYYVVTPYQNKKIAAII